MTKVLVVKMLRISDVKGKAVFKFQMYHRDVRVTWPIIVHFSNCGFKQRN
jgi:hypothetical protein